MTRLVRRLVRVEALRAVQLAQQLANSTDAELAAIAAPLDANAHAWLASLSDDALAAIVADDYAGGVG